MVAHGAMMARGCLWRVRARHAVPLLGKCVNATKNDVATCAKQWRSSCGVALAQATFSRPPAGGACATELLTQHLDCDA